MLQWAAGYLKARGIETALHYPMALHETGAYRDAGFPRGSLPRAEEVCRSILSLPMHPHITTEEVETVAATVREFYPSACAAASVDLSCKAALPA